VIRLLLALTLLLICAANVAAQPTIRERVDQVSIIGSLSMSSVALGLTMACTSTGQCRELNPVMAKAIGAGPVRASVVKSAANGVATYSVWRLTKGKKRTALLATLFAINTLDAVHDIREMRRIGER